MDKDPHSEYRYSQDETWEVDEPEASSLSETELSEQARLRDTLSLASDEEFKAFPHTPLLSPPKKIKHQHEKPTVSKEEILFALKEVKTFTEKFPNEFASEIIEKQAKIALWHYSEMVFDNQAAIWIAICKQMQKLFQIYDLTEDDRQTFQKLRIRILSTLFPQAKILQDFLIKTAIDLKLPSDLAEERALVNVLSALDPNEEIVPLKQNVERAFSRAVLRTEKLRSLEIALVAEQSFVHFLKQLKPKKSKRLFESEKQNAKELCIRSGILAVGIMGLKSKLKIPLILILLLDVIHEIEQSNISDPNQLSKWIWTGVQASVNNKKVIPVLQIILKVLEKTGFVDAISPSSQTAKIVIKAMHHSPLTEDIKAEAIDDALPGDMQIRQFINDLLGSEFKDQNEVTYASRSSKRA